ncbi:hypothetical protein T484DRAFT_1649079, partial [Baffinella frigidus]
VVLCNVMLCYVMLCYVMLCYVMLCNHQPPLHSARKLGLSAFTLIFPVIPRTQNRPLTPHPQQERLRWAVMEARGLARDAAVVQSAFRCHAARARLRSLPARAGVGPVSATRG